MWIDTHSHLNDPAFNNDYQQVITLAQEAEVYGILVVGYDLPSSQRAVAIANAHPRVWAGVGIHPHDAKHWDQSTARTISELLLEPKVVALGEIGLDYHYNHSSIPEQQHAFLEQLALAKEHHKPVIVHDREAHQDLMRILKSISLGPEGGVMHCFSGSYEMAMEAIKLGFYISVAGPITFANANKLRETIGRIPIDRLLVETDAPYLTPHPYRGERNQPARVGLVGIRLAELKGVTAAEMATITSENASCLFKIDLS